MRYNRQKIGTDDVGSNQWWRRLNLGSTIEPTSSLPIFKRLYHIIYKTLALFFLCSWENVKNYHYANFQADPGIFFQQNHLGLNRPILRPLWLMTSAAADVISVPSVIIGSINSSDFNISNIRCNESQNLNDSYPVLLLSVPNPLKPDVHSRMKMQL